MKALHIGAGKIGRGFIGAKLSESGYQLTFADINRDIVAALNREKQYTLHIMEQGGDSQGKSAWQGQRTESQGNACRPPAFYNGATNKGYL